MGHLDQNLKNVRALLQAALDSGIGSGMAASFGKLIDLGTARENDCDIYLGQTAREISSTPVNENTYFDLASLTKILATTTLAMKRYEEGVLDLDGTISGPSKLRVRDLLTHSSGLPAWSPIFEKMRAHFGEQLPFFSLAERREKFYEFLYGFLDSIPKEKKPDELVVYSDLGFMLLEAHLSGQVPGHFKDEVESLWKSLGISGLHFRQVVADAAAAATLSLENNESIAATEICPWRGLLVGQVHDDNAWSLGGIAGHAGVFGRLIDLKAWLRGVFLGFAPGSFSPSVFSRSVFSRATLETFSKEAICLSGTRRALGFDMPSMDGTGSTGKAFSQNSVGHLGFTGTSLWIDLDTGGYAILLTNRVHPKRDDLRIRQLRREFHQKAIE